MNQRISAAAARLLAVLDPRDLGRGAAASLLGLVLLYVGVEYLATAPTLAAGPLAIGGCIIAAALYDTIRRTWRKLLPALAPEGKALPAPPPPATEQEGPARLQAARDRTDTGRAE